MGWKAAAQKVHEARVVKDALARLEQRLDLARLPFAKEELHTLAKRARESFRSREKGKERLESYKARLCEIHGAQAVRMVCSALEEINNEIGYEEK